MATRSIRWALVKDLADQFSQHDLAGAAVCWSFPPGELDVTDEMIFPRRIASDWGAPNVKAGRQERDETITIEWTVMVNGLTTEDACMTRFGELVDVIDDTVASDRTLGWSDADVDAVVTDSDGVPVRAQDGFYVIGTVTTVIETRLL